MRIFSALRPFSFVLFVFVLTKISAQTPAELKDILPRIADWTISETVEVFDSNNLFERINGAAPGYFRFNFIELSTFEYQQNGGDDNSPYIAIQIYRHATKEDAFGIYAAERPGESNFINVGTEGYQEFSMLNFFVDCLYVKIESPSEDDEIVQTITKIAQELGRSVNPQPVFPTQLQFFPSDNKITRSESYIPSGFLGHEFLTNAFIANYVASDKTYQLFIIDAGCTEQAKMMLDKYVQFTKQSINLREGRLTINDRFNGDIECLWTGQYICGIVNDNNAPINVEDVLKEAGKNF